VEDGSLIVGNPLHAQNKCFWRLFSHSFISRRNIFLLRQIYYCYLLMLKLPLYLCVRCNIICISWEKSIFNQTMISSPYFQRNAIRFYVTFCWIFITKYYNICFILSQDFYCLIAYHAVYVTLMLVSSRFTCISNAHAMTTRMRVTQ